MRKLSRGSELSTGEGQRAGQHCGQAGQRGQWLRAGPKGPPAQGHRSDWSVSTGRGHHLLRLRTAPPTAGRRARRPAGGNGSEHASQDPESPEHRLKGCRPVKLGDYDGCGGFQTEGGPGLPHSWKTGSAASEKQLPFAGLYGLNVLYNTCFSALYYFISRQRLCS